MSAVRIRERRVVEHVEHVLTFAWRDDPGAGFSFPCTPDGAVDREALAPEALPNLDGCLSGAFDVEALGVERRTWTSVEPAAIRCSCGREVELYGFTNTCACGRDYNGSGTLLGPREQWGEETGESLADILRIP